MQLLGLLIYYNGELRNNVKLLLFKANQRRKMFCSHNFLFKLHWNVTRHNKQLQYYCHRRHQSAQEGRKPYNSAETQPTIQPQFAMQVLTRGCECEPPHPVRGRDGRRGWRWGPLSSPVVASYRLHIVTTGLSLKCICRQNVTRICHCRLDDHTTSENPQQKLFLHSQPRSSTRSN